jgi:hypothetical protein
MIFCSEIMVKPHVRKAGLCDIRGPPAKRVPVACCRSKRSCSDLCTKRTDDVPSSTTRPKQQSSRDLQVGNPSSSTCVSPGLIESAQRSSSIFSCRSAKKTQASVFMPCSFRDSDWLSILRMVSKNASSSLVGIVLRASRRERIVVCSSTCRIWSAGSKNLSSDHVRREKIR